MESHKYITRKRARFKGLSGKVNIPYGSLLESRGGFLLRECPALLDDQPERLRLFFHRR